MNFIYLNIYYSKLPYGIASIQGLTAQAKIVYSEIYTASKGGERPYFARNEHLAPRCNMTERSLQRALKRLENAELITRRITKKQNVDDFITTQRQILINHQKLRELDANYKAEQGVKPSSAFLIMKVPLFLVHSNLNAPYVLLLTELMNLAENFEENHFRRSNTRLGQAIGVSARTIATNLKVLNKLRELSIYHEDGKRWFYIHDQYMEWASEDFNEQHDHPEYYEYGLGLAKSKDDKAE